MLGGMRGIRAHGKEHSPQNNLNHRGTEEQMVNSRSGWPWVRVIRLRSTETPFLVVAKLEQVHQIADGWTVQRNVRVALAGCGVGEIVPAAACPRSQSPVRPDELRDRKLACIGL